MNYQKSLKSSFLVFCEKLQRKPQEHTMKDKFIDYLVDLNKLDKRAKTTAQFKVRMYAILNSENE